MIFPKIIVRFAYHIIQSTFNQILDETPTVETVTADTALQRDADLVFEDIYFLQILRQSRHIRGHL